MLGIEVNIISIIGSWKVAIILYNYND